jgi:hypothetical protein
VGSLSNALALQVKDFDAAGGSSTQPVPVRGKNEGVDDVSRLERVKVLSLVEIPKHSDTVLSSGGGQGTIGGNGDRVDVAGVAVVICSQFEF